MGGARLQWHTPLSFTKGRSSQGLTLCCGEKDSVVTFSSSANDMLENWELLRNSWLQFIGRSWRFWAKKSLGSDSRDRITEAIDFRMEERRLGSKARKEEWVRGWEVGMGRKERKRGVGES